jgi:hypothetical protein
MGSQPNILEHLQLRSAYTRYDTQPRHAVLTYKIARGDIAFNAFIHDELWHLYLSSRSWRLNKQQHLRNTSTTICSFQIVCLNVHTLTG